jgi:serine protease
MAGGGGYYWDCGTSYSTAYVTSVAALIWTKNPGWTAEQVRQHLHVSVQDLGPPGWDMQFGHGRIDAAKAVGYVPPGPTSVTVTGPSSRNGCTSATWTATTTGGIPPMTYQWTVEGNAFDTGPNNQLTYTNSGEAASIFVTATATDATGGSKSSSPFKTNIVLPGAC